MAISIELLTETEVAQFLRVKRKTLQMWRSQRKGPRFHRVGHRVVYTRTDLERFVAAGLVETDGSESKL